MILYVRKRMEEVRRNRQPAGIGSQKIKSALDADQEGLTEFLLLFILIRRLEKLPSSTREFNFEDVRSQGNP